MAHIVRRQAAVAITALALLAACSGGSDDAATSSTTSTSSPVVTTTTTQPPAIRDPPRVTALLPRAGEPLADGEHAVRITDVGDHEVTVDVVQWLSGEEANAAYAEETGDTSGVPNDYYVRNTSTELRTLPVAPDAEVTLAWNDVGPGEFPASVAEIPAEVAEYHAPYWITVRDGTVIAIHEQYVP